VYKVLTRDEVSKVLTRDEVHKVLARGELYKEPTRDDVYKVLTKDEVYKELTRDEVYKVLTRDEVYEGVEDEVKEDVHLVRLGAGDEGEQDALARLALQSTARVLAKPQAHLPVQDSACKVNIKSFKLKGLNDISTQD
jgi:hypothetical protein